MKILLAALFILAGIYSATAQQHFPLLFQKPAVSSIDSIETAQYSKRVITSIQFSFSKNYFPGSDDYTYAAPLIYFQPTQPFRTEVHYSYSIPDSIVRLIEYTCNSGRKDTTNLKTLFINNAAYLKAYFHNDGNTKQEDHGDWQQTTTIWEDEKVRVEQFMVLGSATYRVRALISWK